MNDEEYSVEVITNNYTIEVDTSSDNLSSSVAIEIADPVANIVEINTGVSNNTVYAANIIGLNNAINNILEDYNLGVNNYRAYTNTQHNTYLSQQNQIVFADSSVADINMYLPDASGFGGGEILVKNIGDHNVYVYPSGSQTVDDLASFTINYKFQSLTFTSNNNNWFII